MSKLRFSYDSKSLDYYGNNYEVGGFLGFTDTNIKIGDENTGINLSDSNISIGNSSGTGTVSGIQSVSITSVNTTPTGYYHKVPTSGGSGSGATVTVSNFGSLQIYVASEFASSFDDPGQNYVIGDVLTIDGGDVGLVSGVDDITITVTALRSNTSSGNVFIGSYAGNSSLQSYDNIFIGTNAGLYDNFGSRNIFLGARAGEKNTGANNNVFIGYEAGQCNITGCTNVFIGLSTAQYSASGDFNNVIGNTAVELNGVANNIMGYLAAYFCTVTGSYNNIFGQKSGYKLTTGSYNNLFGTGPGYDISSGSYNNFFGWYSAPWNTTGSCNTFIGGKVAGGCNSTGNNNIFLGNYTGISTSSSNKIILGNGWDWSANGFFDSPDTTKDTQLAIGIRTDANPSKYWLVGDENFNVGIGTTNPQTKLQVGGVIGFNDTNVKIGDNTTGASITTGFDNVFIGSKTGELNTEGFGNNFFGYAAGSCNISGCFNNFMGTLVGCDNTTGTGNNFLGWLTGQSNTSGSYNNLFGYFAGYSNTTGCYNNVLGRSASFSNTVGSYNNTFGRWAGYSNISGSNNNFFGLKSGYSSISSKNNFFGSHSGFSNVNGSSNIFVGSYSGISTSSSNKVILGSGFNDTNLFDAPDTTKSTQFAVGVRTDVNPANYWLVGDENFNVGIGTTQPVSKFTVHGGDISVGTDNSHGIILTSPNGTKYRIVVDDSGILSTTLVL